MRCLLVYYTGTYNTRFVTGKLSARLEKEGWTVDTHEIDPLHIEQLDYSSYDIIGLGCPIYGFTAPYAFLRFVRQQKFPAGIRAFIYKNSGETYHANDASSKYILRRLRRAKVDVQNEYHFMMPYNIHFRYDDYLIREMFEMNRRLLEILVYEVVHCIPNLRRYRLWPRFVTTVVSRPQYIAGNINSFLYKVDKKKCTSCDLCIRRCPMQNIYRNKKGDIAFHHRCLMCMRCSFYCPTDAFDIGFLEDWGWHVNGGYKFREIQQIELNQPYITPETKGFFKCYIEKYAAINRRYTELFGPPEGIPCLSGNETLNLVNIAKGMGSSQQQNGSDKQRPTIIITGASGSIGAATTREMAGRGYHVVMACRNLNKAATIRQSILADYPGASIELRQLEMSSLSSIRRFAEEWGERRIDVLFNNAGTIARRYATTEDGFEQTMAINYLAPVLLTRLLAPRMPKGGRIVNMVSLTVRFGKMSIDWQEWPETRFSQLGTYSTSKQALLLFSVSLAKRFPHLHINVSDPGVVDSNIISMGRWFDPLADIFFRPFISNAQKGAVSALRALESDGSMHYYVGKKQKPIARKYIESPLAEELWEQASAILGIDT